MGMVLQKVGSNRQNWQKSSRTEKGVTVDNHRNYCIENPNFYSRLTHWNHPKTEFSKFRLWESITIVQYNLSSQFVFLFRCAYITYTDVPLNTPAIFFDSNWKLFIHTRMLTNFTSNYLMHFRYYHTIYNIIIHLQRCTMLVRLINKANAF